MSMLESTGSWRMHFSRKLTEDEWAQYRDRVEETWSNTAQDYSVSRTQAILSQIAPDVEVVDLEMLR